MPRPVVKSLRCETCLDETCSMSHGDPELLKMGEFITECSHFVDAVERQSWIEHYIGYYLATLLVNVILIALYVVQVISEHQPCLTQDGYNITQKFEMSFKAGLFVLLADVANTNVVEIYYRFQVQLEEQKFGVALAASQRLAATSTVTGWFLRVATLLVALFQFLIITSAQGKYCTETFGVLSVEGEWLRWMVGIQVCKAVGFSVWWIKLQQPFSEKHDTTIATNYNSVPDLSRERTDIFTNDQ